MQCMYKLINYFENKEAEKKNVKRRKSELELKKRLKRLKKWRKKYINNNEREWPLINEM